MPTVKFPYTPEGIDAAKKAAEQFGGELIMDDKEEQQQPAPDDLSSAIEY